MRKLFIISVLAFWAAFMFAWAISITPNETSTELDRIKRTEFENEVMAWEVGYLMATPDHALNKEKMMQDSAFFVHRIFGNKYDKK